MSDIVVKDSKGRPQQICMQAFGTSCGPASVAMTERIYKHLSRSDEQRALNLSQKYPGRWDIDVGSTMNNITSVLNAEGVQAYKETYVGGGGVYSYLKYYACFSTPVIAHIQWSNTSAHAVVCAIHDDDDTFVFFDPWYLIVEVRGSDLPNYTVSGVMGTATGTLSGWLVVTHH